MYKLNILFTLFSINFVTFGIRVFPQISHNPLMVEVPMVAIVNNPTHLQLTVKPNPRPVKVNHTYHQN